jgi:hypothetical protein
MRSIGKGEQESSLSVKQEFKLAYKDYSRESVVSPRRKTVQKPAKHTRAAALARLGLTERLVLKCIEEFEKGFSHDVAGAYLFTIADIVDYLVRRFGLSNEGYRLSKAIHKAINRLVNRGIIVRVIKNGRKARGLYALRKDLARLLVGGFSLVNEPIEVLVEEFANSFVGNYVENNVGKVVGNSVFSPSKAGENLWGRAGVLGGGLNGVLYNGGVGGWGVLRSHVINPPGGWVGYYVAVSFVSRVLSFVADYVRGFLVSLYGISYVRNMDSLVNRVFDYVVSSARVDRGCHGRYNDSPGAFSPLSPDCVAHNYEYGVELHVPGYVAQVVDRLINYVKVYAKTPDEIKEGNPRYYEDLLRVLGPPPPPPPGFNDLVARLWSLLGGHGSIVGL